MALDDGPWPTMSFVPKEEYETNLRRMSFSSSCTAIQKDFPANRFILPIPGIKKEGFQLVITGWVTNKIQLGSFSPQKTNLHTVKALLVLITAKAFLKYAA
ncbi:hypothetical protein CDAR_561131 [Caerostris darwini]|uniref:Uncharacterized protein n=1 Tax=Caerostris darwini TaxID=1538125 RepID=A0AAV4TIJ5_9ARAC|nr:hypothetical protein CDAR_561131 [Caerostris darwini]